MQLNYCNQHKDSVVVFLGYDCPLCDIEKELQEIKDASVAMEEELVNTRDELEETKQILREERRPLDQ